MELANSLLSGEIINHSGFNLRSEVVLGIGRVKLVHLLAYSERKTVLGKHVEYHCATWSIELVEMYVDVTWTS